MTMWCPSCLEHLPAQADNICSICGDTLENNGISNDNSSSSPSATLLTWPSQPQSLLNDHALPPEALDPQAGLGPSRPLSTHFQQHSLPRIRLTSHSAELIDAQIHLYPPRHSTDLSPPTDDGQIFQALLGDFGQMNSDTESNPFVRTAALIVCSPRTAKGGLSTQTLSDIDLLRHSRIPFLAYVQRGDITFVQKAILCQNAGKYKQLDKERSLCVGVIVGNTEAVWPYVMQDTTKEAQLLGLTIPVVMISRQDAQTLVQWATTYQTNNHEREARTSNSDFYYLPCRLTLQSKQEHNRCCPICTDSFVPGATIVRLPLCGHVFHESCGMQWLTKHNTCPYCRMEYPTEDEEFERERRQRQARAIIGNDSGLEHDFYG